MKDNIKISFPDGNTKDYVKGVSGIAIAESISKSLVKQAIAISIDGVQKDLSDLIFSLSIDILELYF